MPLEATLISLFEGGGEPFSTANANFLLLQKQTSVASTLSSGSKKLRPRPGLMRYAFQKQLSGSSLAHPRFRKELSDKSLRLSSHHTSSSQRRYSSSANNSSRGDMTPSVPTRSRSRNSVDDKDNDNDDDDDHNEFHESFSSDATGFYSGPKYETIQLNDAAADTPPPPPPAEALPAEAFNVGEGTVTTTATKQWLAHCLFLLHLTT